MPLRCVSVLPLDPPLIEDIRWSPGPGGAPLPAGACAWISCELVQEYDGGDHTIVICRVTALEAEPSRAPLIFHHGRYRALA